MEYLIMNYNFTSFHIKVLHVCIVFVICLLVFYAFLTHDSISQQRITKYDKVIRALPTMKYLMPIQPIRNVTKAPDYNIWLIFTRVTIDSPLKYKFHNVIENLLNVSTVPLKFHVIIDEVSKKIALSEFGRITFSTKKPLSYFFYYIEDVAKQMQDIVSVLMPHFSSEPGTYYSDALFYISLGLHRFAPLSQDLAVIVDCDLYFKDDVALLFQEFSRFKSTALFGLAPELSPVYRHVLYEYRAKHNTSFGDFYHSNNISTMVHPRGYQGYNSGIVLLNLRKIRQSKTYPKVLSQKSVDALAKKYKFKGHLGDQDFYTLLGFEYPDLIQTLNCGFNRQLCTWWRDNGYSDVFDEYFKCEHKIIILHGNCNTEIPK